VAVKPPGPSYRWQLKFSASLTSSRNSVRRHLPYDPVETETPPRYWFTIGHLCVFSLTRWCWQFQAGLLRPHFTQDSASPVRFSYRAITSSGVAFQHSSNTLPFNSAVLQPPQGRNLAGLGSFPFARHYSGNHFCFLFLRLLRCFSSAGSPPLQDD